MKTNIKCRTKTGAASFYIVTISTLVLTIIVVGFIAIVISEIERTLNNDLSNSAYDSALAGVEDAKIAFLDYQSCLNQGYNIEPGYKPSSSSTLTCQDIIYYMENQDCDMVGHILRRIGKNDKGEVLIQETQNGDNGMSQAYTCVKIQSKLDDYRAMLTADNSAQLIPLSFDNLEASSIESIRVSWYSDNNGTTYNFGNKTGFGQATVDQLATPPTISVQLIQTASAFYMSQFDKTVNDTTDRGTLFFVATDQKSSSLHSKTTISGHDFYDVTIDNTVKNNDKQNFLKANDKVSKNLPILTYCPKNSGKEFACSVSIELPLPVGGSRNSDTFMLLVSLPYGGPDTEISVEACKHSNDGFCTTEAFSAGATSEKAQFAGTQINIDSTGRANNLYRRVVTRLDTSNTYYTQPTAAIQLVGENSELIKNITTECEYNFSPTCK